MKPTDQQSLYQNPLRYDAQTADFTEDVPFYFRQVEKFGDPVLELACGTGRITIPIAQKGHKITGLDNSTSMLRRAEEKAREADVEIDWIEADLRTFELNQKFNLIFIPINSFLHLHDRESFEACFEQVKKHLMSTGRFILDVFNPRLDLLMREPGKKYLQSRFPDPHSRGEVVLTESFNYDRAQQVNYVKWYYKLGDDEELVEYNLRIVFPRELNLLLHYNGFKIESKYGNYDLSPFKTDSPKQLVVCRVK